MDRLVSTAELDALPDRLRRRLFGEALRSGRLAVQEPSEAQRRQARALEADLRAALAGEVRFDRGSRALYATDASNYRQVPIGVVLPRSKEDVLATLEICRRHEAPFLARGGGTSLAGQCCNVAVVADFTKYLGGIVELDPARRLARVEPGCVLDQLRDRAREHGLTFGPDPATHSRCTLGGMIGNNSCGPHSILAGRTSDNVLALDVATWRGLRLTVGATTDQERASIAAEGGERGRIYARLGALRDRNADEIRRRFPHIPRRSSGFGLSRLLPEHGFQVAQALTGTEGTCVALLEATVRLVPWPREQRLLVLGFEDVFRAADAVPEVLRHGPIALEGMDQTLVDHLRKKGLDPAGVALLPEGRGWLLAEFGGDSGAEAEERARETMRGLSAGAARPSMRLVSDAAKAQLLWKTRESGLGATAFVPDEDDTWEGWEDSAVAPERLGQYLREFQSLMGRYGYGSALYGHFGDGCLHCRINFDLTSSEGVRRYRDFVEHAADLVVSLGGSFSGEHGDGQSRGELLEKMFGPSLVEAFREFKAIWDPDGKMNPGKVVDARRLDQDLRLGAGFRPARPRTRFRFPDDHGSFGHAALRCVGVGECRKTDHGTMCPSYMVTREERHSTRGRAHLLFEMLHGGALRDGWRDDAVKEALDLCLACKACKSECPVNVDMATAKAEFASHYYRGRLRPRAAYAMGHIDRWARLAALAPSLVNGLARARPTARLLKAAAGIAPERELPPFAPTTFQRWFGQRAPSEATGPAVLLWPDTFTNHFHPDVARCATEVLEGAGLRVEVPRAAVCCGRPLYDFGMLGRAKRLLRRTLKQLEPQLSAGTPIVVLEPSCASVFRDELRSLFPDDPAAQRLREQTFLLSELLERRATGAGLPRLERELLVQGHCHHQSVLGFDAEGQVFQRMGARAQVLDAGCCGMAGSFGFDADKYEVSRSIGERKLLPAVRAASESAIVVADGFSCREQIAHGTGRRALHLAQALWLGQRYGPEGPPRLAERAEGLHLIGASAPRSSVRFVATAAAALALGLILKRVVDGRRA